MNQDELLVLLNGFEWNDFECNGAQLGVAEALQQRFAQAAEQVTGDVERLLSVMSGEMKRIKIQDDLGLKHKDHFRDAYLLPALAAGAIKIAISDKPRSSKQRYRITERGRASLPKGEE